jgi:DNA-directed RNA polymerase specialized sigma24 family protein
VAGVAVQPAQRQYWWPWARRWAVGDERITPHHADELSRCFTAHARELFGYACVLVRGNRPLAEDLVQVTFEAAARTWRVLRDLAEMM